MFDLKTSLAGTTLALGLFGAVAQTATPGADARQNAQSQRIEKGVESGHLTPREATRLERQQSQNARVETRAKADGDVTAAERARVHNNEKRTSQNVRHQKRDRQSN